MQVHRIFKSPRHSTLKLKTTLQVSGLLACALLWQASSAQTAASSMAPPATDSAADASVSVPPVVYRSVFKETSLGVEKDTDNWRKANDEVGKFTRGHVDILKWEEQESAKTLPGSVQKPVAAPDAMQKPSLPTPAAAAPAVTTPPSPSATKPIAAPAHKH